mgnify:FL=1
MGRYIGPKSKIARKFGEAIFGADRVLEKRNFPPGPVSYTHLRAHET